MKELSIEEKAKAYDIALDKIKRLLGTGSNCSREELEYVFPELKESEESYDERIKKAIKYGLDYVFTNNTTIYETTKEQCLFWLEKQGEKKSIDDLTQQEAMDIAVAKCFEQGEQKPVFEMITPEESLGIDSDTYNKIVDECVYGEQTPAWSEEDEKMRAAVLQLITDSEKENGWNCVYCNDKEIYFSDIIAWLESLRPQKQWKPSEEQLKSLKGVIDVGYFTSYPNSLETLYEQLKKLKGE